jgi:CrcB protein
VAATTDRPKPQALRLPPAELAAIFVGGALGTSIRAALAETFVWHPGLWPWQTLSVNVVGAFIIAFAAVRLAGSGGAVARGFVGAGFCGGLTTFSTLVVEAVRMGEADRWGTLAAYLALTLVVGYMAVRAGEAVARG